MTLVIYQTVKSVCDQPGPVPTKTLCCECRQLYVYNFASGAPSLEQMGIEMYAKCATQSAFIYYCVFVSGHLKS